MKLDVDIRDSEVTAWMRALESDQLPFATSLAVNDTAKDFQEMQRRHMDRAFTVRRKSFMRRSVKIRRDDFATKRKPEATVRIESPGDRSDIFAKFEEGGEMTPHGVRTRFAVPDAAGRTQAGVIQKGQRPKAFSFQEAGRSGGTIVYKGKRGTFMVRKADGTGGIYQRQSKGRRLASDVKSRNTRDMNLRTLYRFTPSATIDQRLEFVETAEKTVAVRFGPNFTAAFDRAIGMGAPRRQARRTAMADVFDLDRVPRRVR